MNANRIGPGATIAGVAGAILLIVMFLGWFQLTGLSADSGVDIPGGSVDLSGDELDALAEQSGQDTTASAWQAFEFIDIVLALAAAAALAYAVASAVGPANRIVAMVAGALGLLAAILVLFRLISPPDLLEAFGGSGNVFGIEVDTDIGRELWAFVGFIAAAGIAYGGWRGMQEEPPAPAPTTAPGGTAATPPPPPSTGSGTGTGTGPSAPPGGPTV
jgi:hypothetical protein